MPYAGFDNVSGYQARYSPFTNRREDADGRVHVLAKSINGATATVAKVLFPHMSVTVGVYNVGYFATVPFTTGKTSTTAAASQIYFVGAPNDTIASGSDGWFQIGGPFKGLQLGSASDAPINGMFKWQAATFTASGAWTVASAMIDTWGLSMSSVSSGTYDVYLLGNPVCGATV